VPDGRNSPCRTGETVRAGRAKQSVPDVRNRPCRLGCMQWSGKRSAHSGRAPAVGRGLGWLCRVFCSLVTVNQVLVRSWARRTTRFSPCGVVFGLLRFGERRGVRDGIAWLSDPCPIDPRERVGLAERDGVAGFRGVLSV
jgi:hypothetical protein